MSLGLGFTLPDGVVLVADGRRVYPQAKNAPAPHDDIDKLVPINETTFAIPFGVTQATNKALRILQERSRPALSPEMLAEVVDFSVAAAWAFLHSCLAEDVDLHHPSMRAALIVGGIAEHVPFLIAVLHGPSINQKPVLLKGRSFQFVLLGGESFSSNQYFTEQADRLLCGVQWEPTAGPLNPTVRAVLEASSNTIRHIESRDSTVGGTRRYVVIRAGFPVEKAVL